MRRGLKLMIARLGSFALGLSLFLAPLSISRADETIALAFGGGSVFRMQEPFQTVLIGDPDVIDVHIQDDRSVILKALKLGSSNILFLDGRSIVIVKIRVVVSDVQI